MKFQIYEYVKGVNLFPELLYSAIEHRVYVHSLQNRFREIRRRIVFIPGINKLASLWIIFPGQGYDARALVTRWFVTFPGTNTFIFDTLYRNPPIRPPNGAYGIRVNSPGSICECAAKGRNDTSRVHNLPFFVTDLPWGKKHSGQRLFTGEAGKKIYEKPGRAGHYSSRRHSR